VNAVNAIASQPSASFESKTAAYLSLDARRAGVRNIRTTVVSLGDGDTLIPATVNHCEDDNAWVCSPHTTYVRYAMEELRRFGKPWIGTPLRMLCRSLGRYLWRARIDDAVAVNNWLLSTNVYPAFDPRALRRWLTEAVDRWPGHAVWFRSLNERYVAEWLKAAADAGGELIPSRQVYLFDRIDRDARRPRDLHRDFRLLDETALQPSPALEWTAGDFDRAAQLYGKLYLEKYSRLNPDYTAEFLGAWHRAGLLRLTGFRDDTHELQAVLGTFELTDTITAPIVGYNTDLPQELGLYRLLMASVCQLAASSGRRINLSAGAAHFKRSRGGIAAMEYSVVFAGHLPAHQRRALRLLASITRRVGEPIMRRFEL
jgi:hypothetical protein